MKAERTTRTWALALLLAACEGNGGTAADGDTTAAETTSSSDPVASTTSGGAECYAGYEKCPCMDGLCLDGLVCLSDLCVQPAIEASSSDAGESTTTVLDDASESSSTESSSEESSTTVVPDNCLDEDNYCDDDTLQVCDEGFWQYTSCSDWCAEFGYMSPGCATPDACECDGYADDFCYVGAYNLCLCADVDFDIPCTEEQLQIFYDECWTMANTYVACFNFGEEVDEVADCAPLENACL
jgi:hypothetical protein